MIELKNFLSQSITSSTKINEVTVDSTKRQLSSGSSELSNDPKKSKSISLNEIYIFFIYSRKVTYAGFLPDRALPNNVKVLIYID